MTPFVVLSLPRSRSAWIARFLSYQGRRCGHDLATQCGTMAEFAAMIESYGGTAETGAVVGWRAIRRMLPEVKIAVVRRSPDQVYSSLARFGLGSPALIAELNERDLLLDKVARLPGVPSFDFRDLEDISACQELFEYCLGIPFDWEWWESLANVNVQIDMAERLSYLAAHRERIENLKRDAARIGGPAEVSIKTESWDAVWPEIDALFAEHFNEVEGDLGEQRPYKLDEPMMRGLAAAGQLRIVTARVDDLLVGYCMWQVTKDVESAGMLIALHGPWFVKPQFAHLLLGPKLFDVSIADLKSIGVKNAFPHHRLAGRGAKLGTFFKRRGAVETQRTYSLWLGEARHA